MATLNLGGLQPARILKGTVISSNSETYRVEVAFDGTGGAGTDVQVASLYCHPYDGEGIDVLPSPDANVYVFFPSEANGRPFIMGYVMPPSSSNGDMGGRRPRKHGEYVFRGRDGNFLALRSGGILEIGASPLAQTLYLPIGNMIREVFEQKECLSILGHMKWTHADVGSDLTTKATFSFAHKDAAEDLFPKVTLDISSDLSKPDFMPEAYVSPRPSTTFTSVTPPKMSLVRFKVDGGLGLSGKNVVSEFAIQVSADGDVYVHSEGYMLLDSMGPLRIESKDSIEVVTPRASDLTSIVGARTILTAYLDAKAEVAMTLTAPVIDMNGAVRLSGASSPFSAVNGELLLGWMAAVSLVTSVKVPEGVLSTSVKL